MAKIGVKDLYAFPITAENDGEMPTYGPGFRIAKAIEVSLKPQTAEAELYADDALDEVESAITGYDISAQVNDLSPDVESKLLGKEVDDLGGISSKGNDPAPYFAIGFRVKLSKGAGGGYEYRILYKVRFTQPDESYSTQGEKVDFQTPTITGKSMSVGLDGLFNYKLADNGTKESVTAVTKTWFTTVYVPKAKTGAPAQKSAPVIETSGKK